MLSDETMKSIGERIKQLREKKGESQTKLGEIIGLSQNAISKIEKGDTQLTLENQFSIAEHFNVSHDYLCTGKDNDSILKLLEKYISLKYQNISNGEKEKFLYPVLSINKVYFDYLVKIANAKRVSDMPDDIRELWVEKEETVFYTHNKKNDFSVSESIVPLPQSLIYPDDEKAEWKQSDLLREMNNLLLENAKSTNNNEGE